MDTQKQLNVPLHSAQGAAACTACAAGQFSAAGGACQQCGQGTRSAQGAAACRPLLYNGVRAWHAPSGIHRASDERERTQAADVASSGDSSSCPYVARASP